MSFSCAKRAPRFSIWGRLWAPDDKTLSEVVASQARTSKRVTLKVCDGCMIDRRGCEREELTIHVHAGRCHLCGIEGDRHATPITLD